MIQIKFRAWDNKNKGRCHYTNSDCMNNLNNKDCDINQYVGLNDKNGKEIYEGDIINVFNMNVYGEDIITSKSVKVYFQNGSFGFISQITNSFFSFSSCNRPGTSFRIIGNIYENPELLDTKGIE